MPSVSSDAPLLDPKNDYVFKRLFAQRIDLLTDLVNLVRGGAELEVQLELNFLELPKLARLGLEKTNKPLYDWCLFFSNPNGVDVEQITHPSVKEAFAVLKSVSATAQERADAEKRIKYVRDLNAMIGAGWDEGRAAGIEIGRSEGIAVGIAVGKAEGKAELLERLLMKKFGALSEASRSRLLSATDDELNDWSEALLVAATLEEVFGTSR